MSREVEHNGSRDDRAGHAWFQIERMAGCAVVRVGGDIDTQSIHRFDVTVTEAVGLARHVVIDLAQVTFVDSSGLGALIVARKSARQGGGSMSLVSPPAVVRRLLGSTQLHDVFAIYDSLDEALNAPIPP
jgi:anti-anti-sigma factor